VCVVTNVAMVMFLKDFEPYVIQCVIVCVIEHRGRVVNTLVSLSGGHGFKSRPVDRLFRLRFS
jgi:hypothetical protein